MVGLLSETAEHVTLSLRRGWARTSRRDPTDCQKEKPPLERSHQMKSGTRPTARLTGSRCCSRSCWVPFEEGWSVSAGAATRRFPIAHVKVSGTDHRNCVFVRVSKSTARSTTSIAVVPHKRRNIAKPMYGTKLVGCAKMAEPAQHKRNALREKRRHETHEDVQSASSMAASHSSSGALMRQFNHYLHNELDCPDGCASIL